MLSSSTIRACQEWNKTRKTIRQNPSLFQRFGDYLSRLGRDCYPVGKGIAIRVIRENRQGLRIGKWVRAYSADQINRIVGN